MRSDCWKNGRARLNALLTGRVEWVDPEDGAFEVEWLGWRDRWSLFGIHSHTWDWVRKYGKMPCGCTRNPLTRRMVLINWRCTTHCSRPLTEDDD